MDWLQTSEGWCPRRQADTQAVLNSENDGMEATRGFDADCDALMSTRDGLVQEPQGVADVAVIAGRLA